jgi:hypothetical protein
MDPVLVIFDRTDLRKPVHGQSDGEPVDPPEVFACLDIIGHVTEWTGAYGRRLILISDVPTMLIAGLSIFAADELPMMARPEGYRAPIVFAPLHPQSGPLPSEEERLRMDELQEFGFINIDSDAPSDRVEILRKLLGDHRPDIIIGLIRDPELWREVEKYQHNQPGRFITSYGISLYGFGSDFASIKLDPNREAMSALPPLAADDEELVREERSARQAAALVASLLESLPAPPRPEPVRRR